LRVAVVGGGISGLAAAHALVARGDDVVLLDADARPGGLIRSERRDGFLCEAGPQALLDGPAETRALIAAAGLGGRALAARPEARRRFVYVRGKLRPLPTSPPALIKTDLVSARAKLRLLAEPFVRRRRADGAGGGDTDDESVLAFAERRFGVEVARSVVAPAVIGIYAGDAASLSIGSALPRLAEMERRSGSVLRAAIAGRRKGGGGIGRACSFPDGLEELPRALAAALGDRRRVARAAGLERAAAGWRVACDGGAAVEADRVVLAVPAESAAALLAPLPGGPDAAAALRAVPMAPVAVACLGFRPAASGAVAAATGVDLGAYGFLVARGEGVRLLGCQYESSIFEHRAPEGAVLLRAILGGTFDPAIVDASDDAVAAQAAGDLRRVAGLARDPDFVAVYRYPAGIPQYDLGQAARVRAVDAALAALPGLTVIGQAVRGVGLADCIRAGAAVAGSAAAAASA
jgi:oxygen-dependent protoporphyrinogen oxidase